MSTTTHTVHTVTMSVLTPTRLPTGVLEWRSVATFAADQGVYTCPELLSTLSTEGQRIARHYLHTPAVHLEAREVHTSALLAFSEWTAGPDGTEIQSLSCSEIHGVVPDMAAA